MIFSFCRRDWDSGPSPCAGSGSGPGEVCWLSWCYGLKKDCRDVGAKRSRCQERSYQRFVITKRMVEERPTYRSIGSAVGSASVFVAAGHGGAVGVDEVMSVAIKRMCVSYWW